MNNNKSLISLTGSRIPEKLSLPQRAVHARVRTHLGLLQYRDNQRGALARLLKKFHDEKSV
jgi:hypothetical protein